MQVDAHTKLFTQAVFMLHRIVGEATHVQVICSRVSEVQIPELIAAQLVFHFNLNISQQVIWE